MKKKIIWIILIAAAVLVTVNALIYQTVKQKDVECIVSVDESAEISEPQIECEPEVVEEVMPVELVVAPEPEPYIHLTEQEKWELATLIYLEGGNQSYECQLAIGSVILNRIHSGYWGTTLHEVIYAKNQFTPAYLISSTNPTDTQIAVVEELVMNGPTLPYYVLYFRANYYFSWANDYCNYNDTYFSFLSKDV
jgi:hypothetical protein